MKKQLKITILTALLLVGLFSVSVSANPLKNPLLMGEIKKVEKCSDSDNIKLTVDGYMKGCETYKDKVLVIVDKNTKIHEGCKKECKEEIKFNVGDYVSVVLDKKITKSIPPQAYSKRIQVTQKKHKSDKETSVNDTSVIDEEKNAIEDEENAMEEEEKELRDEETFEDNKEIERKDDEKPEIKK